MDDSGNRPFARRFCCTATCQGLPAYIQSRMFVNQLNAWPETRGPGRWRTPAGLPWSAERRKPRLPPAKRCSTPRSAYSGAGSHAHVAGRGRGRGRRDARRGLLAFPRQGRAVRRDVRARPCCRWSGARRAGEAARDDPLGALRALAVDALDAAGARSAHAGGVRDHVPQMRARRRARPAQRRAAATGAQCLSQRRERCSSARSRRDSCPADTDTRLATKVMHAYMVGIMHEWVLDPAAYDLARGRARDDRHVRSRDCDARRRASACASPRETRTSASFDMQRTLGRLASRGSDESGA